MKKKILFIDGPLGAGGAERVLIDILQNFDYDKFEVDLALICKIGPLINEIPNKVNVIELWRNYSWSYKFSLRLSLWFRSNWLLSRKMNGRKLRKDYDLEISFLEGMPIKLHALRKSKAKKATWVHADLFTNPYEKSQFFPGEELKAYNSMDYIINVSKGCLEGFNRRFPLCKSEKRIIHNPINNMRIENLSQKKILPGIHDIFPYFTPSDKVVVTVGRVEEIKNPKRFLNVAELSKKNKLPLKFLWIGDGKLKSLMDIEIKKRGLQDYVFFYGFTSNPYSLVKNSDIFLLTSDSESFSLAICEAMFLGLPVIAVNSSGPKEIVEQNKSGFIVSDNTKDIIDKLEILNKDETLRKEMSKEAIKRSNLFNITNTLSALYKLLN